MVQNQEPIFITTLLVTAVLSMASAQAQESSRGYVPRHERVAASVLRRGPVLSSVRTATRSVVQQSTEPTSDDALSVGGIESPPAPPATLSSPNGGVGNATSAPSPVVAGHSAESNSVESYPVMPNHPGVDPGIAYENPFSTPQCYGCDDVGCAGGPGCGAAPLVACGGDTCRGDCSRGCRNGGYLCIDTLSINLGVQSFTNTVNRGESGSFGFREGFNWGSPWVCGLLGMNTQFGFSATQSNFNGSDITTDHRAQFFVTAGFFKRNYNGWQGGFVFDYLHDDWYTTLDLSQIRGELSYAVPNGSSVGMLFATSVSEDDASAVINRQNVNQSWESHDIFAAFYKVQSNQHRLGQWRVYVGFTGDRDGIIGSDFKVPLAGTWSLEPEFTYLVPDEVTGAGGHERESWNIAFNLAWYPARARGTLNYRLLPMFDVAGNGSMITRRK